MTKLIAAALAVLGVAGMLSALAPAPALADGGLWGSHRNMYAYIRAANTGCESGDSVGNYVAGTPVHFQVRLANFVNIGRASCSPDMSITDRRSYYNDLSREFFIGWKIRVSASAGGAPLTGAHIGLPASFGGASDPRSSSPLAQRSGLASFDRGSSRWVSAGADGWWPASGGGDTGGTARMDVPVLSLTVPASHSGDVYVKVDLWGYDWDGYHVHNHYEVKFEQVQPIQAAPAAADPACPHLLVRTTRLIRQGSPNSLYGEHQLLDCGGSTRWAVRQYWAVAPLPNFRVADYAGACTDVKIITIGTFEQREDDDGTEYHWRYRGQRYCSTYYYPEFYGLTYWARCEPHHRVAVDVLDRRLMPGTTTVAYHVRVSWTTLCHDPDHRSWESPTYDNTTTETYWTTQPPAVVPAASSSP